MTFLQRNWKPVIIVVLAIFGTGAFLFLKNNSPQESVIIYKTTQPAPKQKQADAGNTATHAEHEHNHEHPHDNISHSHTTEDTLSDSAYDWREDNGLNSPRLEEDPWKHTYTQGAELPDNGDKETYPPQDWYKTEDPALYIQYLRAQLIKQFGDIPQVHIFVEWREKRIQGIPIKNAEEYITFLEAQYYLWPSDTTLRTLETLRNERAEGVRITFRSENKKFLHLTLIQNFDILSRMHPRLVSLPWLWRHGR